MRSHFERTADLMLEHLGSGDDPGWVYFRQFGEWELLFNLDDDRRFVPKLVRNLAQRGLVETRRVSAGMQCRMTDAGRHHCEDERSYQDTITAEFGPMHLDLDQTCPSESAESVS